MFPTFLRWGGRMQTILSIGASIRTARSHYASIRAYTYDNGAASPIKGAGTDARAGPVEV